MVGPTTWLPQVYQRWQVFWDRAVPAAGLALLLWASSQATGAYPFEWELFLTAALFGVGLLWPWVAYAAFTFLVAYPLYCVSIYVAAIVLAALILTSRWAMRNLGAAVLVLLCPALLPWHLEATVPLLAGLWWGELAGALAGGLAALWLKLLAGMAGQPLNLAQLSGQPLASARIIQRYSGFNSLQTLVELVNPFADTSSALLLHVLQVLAWALAGYLAGWVTRRTWSERWRGWAPLLGLVPSGAVLWLSVALLPELLGPSLAESAALAYNPLWWVLTSVLLGAGVRRLYLYLRRPVRRPARRGARFQRPRRGPAASPEPRGTAAGRGEAQQAFQWTASQGAPSVSEADDDIIMLEID